MDTILSGLDFAVAYLNDILIKTGIVKNFANGMKLAFKKSKNTVLS